jgi:hypothetical protein
MPAGSTAPRLGGEEPGQARDVGEHVDGHRAEPQDERGLDLPPYLRQAIGDQAIGSTLMHVF